MTSSPSLPKVMTDYIDPSPCKSFTDELYGRGYDVKFIAGSPMDNEEDEATGGDGHEEDNMSEDHEDEVDFYEGLAEKFHDLCMPKYGDVQDNDINENVGSVILFHRGCNVSCGVETKPNNDAVAAWAILNIKWSENVNGLGVGFDYFDYTDPDAMGLLLDSVTSFIKTRLELHKPDEDKLVSYYVNCEPKPRVFLFVSNEGENPKEKECVDFLTRNGFRLNEDWDGGFKFDFEREIEIKRSAV